MINLQCENFKHKIIQDINNSNLPPVVAYYILENCLFQLEKVCQETLKEESSDSGKEKTESIELNFMDEETKETLEKASKFQEQLTQLKEAE